MIGKERKQTQLWQEEIIHLHAGEEKGASFRFVSALEKKSRKTHQSGTQFHGHVSVTTGWKCAHPWSTYVKPVQREERPFGDPVSSFTHLVASSCHVTDMSLTLDYPVSLK